MGPQYFQNPLYDWNSFTNAMNTIAQFLPGPAGAASRVMQQSGQQYNAPSMQDVARMVGGPLGAAGGAISRAMGMAQQQQQQQQPSPYMPPSNSNGLQYPPTQRGMDVPPPEFRNYNPVPMPSYPPSQTWRMPDLPEGFEPMPYGPMPMYPQGPQNPGMFRGNGDDYWGGVPHTQAPRDVEKL